MKTADVCRKHGISSATFYKWKAKYGGLEVSDARRLKALEDENAQAEEAAGRGDARQRHAEGSQRKKMVTPAAKREAVAHLCQVYEVSQRRACQALGADRSSVRYRSVRPDDAGLRTRLRELAAVRRRFGYRRLLILLGREGAQVNHKKLRRLYREERLQVRRRGGRKRALGTRAPMALPQGAEPALVARLRVRHAHRRPPLPHPGRGRRLHPRVPGLVADTSLSGARVARELDAIIARRGRPLTIVSDNGTELTSMAILRWAQDSRDRLALHRARQADAERLHRELQRPAARRAAERDAVHLARPCPSGAGDLEGRLQHRQAAQRASAICRRRSTPISALPRCNGTGRCAHSGAPRPVPLHHRARQAQMRHRLYFQLDETWGSGQSGA